MRRTAALLLLLLLPDLAWAGLTQQQLGEVALAPPANARVPLDLTFGDLSGRMVSLRQAIADRPTVLLPADFTCTQICSPALSILSGALKQTGLAAGRDYSLVIVGIDARDNIDDARQITAGQADEAGVSVLLGDAGSIRSLTEAIGYHVQADAGNDAVAHPAGLVTLTADGHVSRALSSLALNPVDLRLALVEAGEGRIGGWANRLKLMCYGFDAVHGLYTDQVLSLLRVVSSLTVAALAAILGALFWSGGRRRSAS
jgi:protein SCO1/2